jgi:hypothetical protein
MFDQELVKSMMSLYNNFLFRKGFFDFFHTMQREGIEAARKFWHSYPYKNILFPNAMDMYEKMIDFYINLGLVPKAKYEEVFEEHAKLHSGNTFLRETIKQLQLKIFSQGEQKVCDAWNSIIDKQIEMNKEIAGNFFELFGQSSADSYGTGMEERFDNIERRRQIRHKFLSSVEFVLNDAGDRIMKGVLLNISDSGLCMYSYVPLGKGQKIIIKSSLPIRHQAFTVQWSNVYMTGLSA